MKKKNKWEVRKPKVKKKAKKVKYIYRSAITGKVVTKQYAELNPETTVREKIK